MSSTYSSDLRIQLMGAGDQAGTWGSTTNNNFQYIFEQAIAGLQVVSVTTTPQALTYLNGATPTLANNQAICAVLQLSNGGVGANFTLTTPSGAQKTYVVFNNTAYVATMQVTGSSGSTIAIPAGVTATVYTDGTNFYAGSTGTVGNFSVNGALSATGSVTASNHIGAGTGLTGTATSLSIGGNAATATTATTATTAGTCTGNAATATNPASGGSFITSSNIGSQSVSHASSADSASTATTATTASALTSSGVLTVLAAAYPVGSIYMNTSSGTNPATLLGFGTWAALAAGQMLLGNGGGYTAGNTGGSASIALSTANLPSHSHGASGLSASSSSSSTSSTSVSINGNTTGIGLNYPVGQAPGGPGTRYYGGYTGIPDGNASLSDPGHSHSASASTTTSTSTSTTISGNTDAVGSGTSITTISPYLVVYMWQRTA